MVRPRHPANRERMMTRYTSGRNWLIFLKYKAGWTHKAIGKEFKIADVTSMDIVRQVKYWLDEKAKDEAAAKEVQPC